MKRKEIASLLCVGALLSGVITAAGAGNNAGTSANPLISVEWLQNTFLPGVRNDLENQIDESLSQVMGTLTETSAEGTELRLKRGDLVTIESGSTLTLLAGELSASVGGNILDLTEGEALSESSGTLALNHRYLLAEDSKGVFSVTTDTASVCVSGYYRLAPSREVDYYALGDALHAMNLFLGTNTVYGSGYDLEQAPNRIQGLIMFLRLLGEEDAALSYENELITFTDVPKWARPYVAYAYSKGYTNGQGIGENGEITFGSSNTLKAEDFVTFLLRAMKYQEGTDFQWKSALTDARQLGVLTEGEVALLSEKPFLRAQIVYLSYFALSSKMADGNLLMEQLTEGGKLTTDQINEVLSGVSVERL